MSQVYQIVTLYNTLYVYLRIPTIALPVVIHINQVSLLLEHGRTYTALVMLQ